MAEEFDSLSDNRALTRTTVPSSVDNNQNAEDYAQALKTQAQQYGQQALDGLNKAKGYAQEYGQQAVDKFKDLQGKDLTQIAEEAKDFARRKPVQAIAISAAVGIVVGFILNAGRRR